LRARGGGQRRRGGHLGAVVLAGHHAGRAGPDAQRRPDHPARRDVHHRAGAHDHRGPDDARADDYADDYADEAKDHADHADPDGGAHSHRG
jgi:hypothetical protein